MKNLKEFMERNISAEPYNLLRFSVTDFYPKIKIDFDSVSENLVNRAKKDIQLFNTIEKNRLLIDRPLVGDYVRKKNGELTKIGMFINDKFQDTNGGSFHVNKCGYGSFSGGFTMDIFNIKDLKPTKELKKLYCWMFSNGMAGGNRGVYEYINVRVWNLEN